MTSPGSRVMAREMNAMICATGKIISRVCDAWRVSPLTRQPIGSCCGSGISSVVTTTGPSGQNVSAALPRIHCLSPRWTSRAVTSLAAV